VRQLSVSLNKPTPENKKFEEQRLRKSPTIIPHMREPGAVQRPDEGRMKLTEQTSHKEDKFVKLTLVGQQKVAGIFTHFQQRRGEHHLLNRLPAPIKRILQKRKEYPFFFSTGKNTISGTHSMIQDDG
jgi:hypothetical protein